VGDLTRYSVARIRHAIETAPVSELPGLVALLRSELADIDGLDVETMRADPASMAAYVTKGKFRRWPYVRLLSDKFVAAHAGTAKRQVWTLPARYGKSSLASRWGLIWLLDRAPESQSILVSYGDTLASEHAVFVRDALEQNPGLFRVKLRQDRRRVDRFVTEEGGGVLAAGIGSGITGFGAGGGGGVVFDDPHKNWQEAHSAAKRDYVWRQFLSVVTTRLDDEAAWIIVVMTRWHEDDLAGRLARIEDETQEPWELVRLPAIAEAHDPNSHDPSLRLPDPLGRQLGQVLEPERFSEREVLSRRATLGSYLAASMEQQRPAPEEGGEIKRDWWRWESSMPTSGDEWIASWDMKMTERDTGSYVVGQAWSRSASDFYCHAQLRGRMNFATVRCAIALLAVRFPQASTHCIESTGNGPEVMAALRAADAKYQVSDDVAGTLGMSADEREQVEALMRRGVPGILPVTPRGNKVARIRAVSAYIEAGNVHLPDGADWAAGLVDEHSAFPNGAFDDQVDALSQALAVLSGRLKRVGAVAPRGDAQPSHWRQA